MAGIEVPVDLYKPLEQLAQERGQSVTAIVEGLITSYLREQRHRYLLDEMERYRTQHASLTGKYTGKFVAMREGQVLDHDNDGGTLYKRVRRRYGDLPVLIVLVTEQPEQTFTRLSRQVAS